MDKSIESQSLFLLNTLSSAAERARGTFIFLDESFPPSEILSLTDKYLRLTTIVDTAASVSLTTSAQLARSYYADIQYYLDLQNQLINKVNERKATGAQLNINADLYDGENILKEIRIIENDTVDVIPITKPEEYSVLKIVEKVKNSPIALNAIKENDKQMFETLNNSLKYISSSVLTIRRLLKNPKYMTIMSTDSASTETISYSSALFRSIRSIVGTLDNIRDIITESFQLHLIVAQNYEIYSKAVDTITSIALESIFDPTATYEFQ